MKRLIIAAAALMAMVHAASAQLWASADCASMVERTIRLDGFRYVQFGVFDTMCYAGEWPISASAASITCDNGIKTEIRLIDASAIEFNSMMMQELTTENDFCPDRAIEQAD